MHKATVLYCTLERIRVFKDALQNGINYTGRNNKEIFVVSVGTSTSQIS